MKNNLQNNKALEKKIDWENIKKQMREKFGNDIYESWIKKIDLHENDFVFIEKGGEIIPKIVSVDKQKRINNSKPVVFTKTCPSCKNIIMF